MTQDVTITAKKLRTELKNAFNNCKFSVKCKKFSMGQEIDIFWNDGVSELEVEALIDRVEKEYNAQDIEIRNMRSTFIFTNRKVSIENREAVKVSILEGLVENPVEGLIEREFYGMISRRVAATSFF